MTLTRSLVVKQVYNGLEIFIPVMKSYSISTLSLLPKRLTDIIKCKSVGEG